MTIFSQRVIVPPAIEPVTKDECKLDSRIDGAEFDSLLDSLIAAAREMCEQATDRRLITQTVRVTAADWPRPCDQVVLSPLQSATVSYWGGGAWVPLDAGQFVITEHLGLASIVTAQGASWPSLGSLVGPRVRIDAVVGYGNTASDVPPSLRMWIRQHVAAMLRSPDGLGDEKKMAPMPYLSMLLDPHRVWGI